MSYMETRRIAPFGAITLYRAGSALTDALDTVSGAFGRRRTAITELSPAELEDIGLSIADLPVENRTISFGGIAAFFRTWNARRHTIAELSRLSEAQLDDIGLTRWNVEELRAGRVSF